MRLVAGWSLLLVCVVLAAATLWSRGRDVSLKGEGRGSVAILSLTSGELQASLERGRIDNYSPGGGWAVGKEPYDGPWRWGFTRMDVVPESRWWSWRWSTVLHRDGSVRFAAGPVWPGAVLAGVCGLWLLWPMVRAWRRRSGGRCAACGYDLRGLGAGAKCPECGKVDG